MFPDAKQSTSVSKQSETLTAYTQLCQEFVGEARSQLATLTGEIAMRNETVLANDSYIYGNLLARSLKVPAGHDFTPVNWLRRTVEIHRTQTMGSGFTVVSSYHGVDDDAETDPQAKQNALLLNQKKKSYAGERNKLMSAILRDNGGEALWARMVENASAVGDSILKTWYDEDSGKFKLEMIEAIEHFYVLWNKSNFREFDFTGYVYQISKQQAVDQFGVPENIATSPLGAPLAVLSSASTVGYVSTQPMVTIMEVNGRIQGWKSVNGKVKRCAVGDETKLNAVIVGDRIYRMIDDPKYLPKYYIFPNKLIRRRPWGLPDITSSAININQTYIETLSDWRTVSSKINFPKWKAFGFGLDVQMPKPKARTTEILPLGEGQDIQPIQNPNSQGGSEVDFTRQLDELKQAFVREVGISRQLFDLPDSGSANSNQAMMTAMKSISDQVEARRQLWEPIINKVFEDAFEILALWDDNIKEITQADDDWYIRVEWPPAMRKDDPAYQTMLLNRFNTGAISIQSMFERFGENPKEEIDRINDEMNSPITAAIHGHMLQLLASLKISGPPTSAPPKINVNLRGDITPEQETNLSVMHQFGEGPIYGPSSGPQGELGIRATDNAVNDIGGPNPTISGEGYKQGQPNIKGGATLPQAPQAPAAPQMITPPNGNQPGQQMMSQPGSGQATPNSAAGNVQQISQRRGKK
jgi:hypothetical protein